MLNDNKSLINLVKKLQPLRKKRYEIIVVDGGSEEILSDREQAYFDQYVLSNPGRAKQMNAGANDASGAILWFLHADSLFDHKAVDESLQQLETSDRCWGRFDVKLSGDDWRLNIIAFFMNWRSALTGVATGDQGIFVYKSVFEQVNQFPDIPIMEDIALSKLLLKHSRPLRIKKHLVTSGRRWLTHGVFKTVTLMWILRLGYFLGVKPERLARFYKPCTNNSIN